MLKKIRIYSIYVILGCLLVPSLNAMSPDLLNEIRKKRENTEVIHKKDPAPYKQENPKSNVDSTTLQPVESKVKETEAASEKPLNHKGCCSIQ